MSTDPFVKLLQEGASLGQQTEEHIIMKELSRLANGNKWETSPCVLQDVGNYLTQTTALLSSLATSLINSNDIESYAQRRVREAQEYNDLSELDPVDYLHEKHTALK
jgi:hypothetical protein